jgi:hypothetical protein
MFLQTNSIERCSDPWSDLVLNFRNSGEFGDFGQIPGPSSSLFRGAAAAAAAAFSPHTNRGKLLQHKLIRVQCTKKSTRVPVSPVPQYGYWI